MSVVRVGAVSLLRRLPNSLDPVLLRSGVKNDLIGRGMVLHASMPVMGLFDKTIDALSGTPGSVFVGGKLISDGYALESMSDQPLYAALMSPGPPRHTFEMVKAYRNLAGFGVMLADTPSPENRLTLDKEGEPVIHYVLSEADKDCTFRSEFLRRVALGLVFKRQVFVKYLLRRSLCTEEPLPQWIRTI